MPAPYIRKTTDEYRVLGNYGSGWEEVYASGDYSDARERLREYKANEPPYAFRFQTARVPIHALPSSAADCAAKN